MMVWGSACTDFPRKNFRRFVARPENIFRIFCEPPKFFGIILKNRERKKAKNVFHELFS